MDEFFELLRQLNGRLTKILQRAQGECLTPFGLGVRHAPYLLWLSRDGREGVTLSELSRAVCLDKANTTRVVRDLSALGLAQLEEDGRRKLIRLSPRGEEIARALGGRIDGMREAMFSSLNEGERAALLGILRKLEASEFCLD